MTIIQKKLNIVDLELYFNKNINYIKFLYIYI